MLDLDKLFKESFFLDWLHRLTVAGYNEGITISADHRKEIALLYLDNKTPNEALADYKQLIKEL